MYVCAAYLSRSSLNLASVAIVTNYRAAPWLRLGKIIPLLHSSRDQFAATRSPAHHIGFPSRVSAIDKVAEVCLAIHAGSARPATRAAANTQVSAKNRHRVSIPGCKFRTGTNIASARYRERCCERHVPRDLTVIITACVWCVFRAGILYTQVVLTWNYTVFCGYCGRFWVRLVASLV